MYTILGSERSPFVRACRMLMIANKIPHDFRVLNFVDDAKAAAEVASETPINRVPVVYTPEGEKIFDSRVIARYLTKRHSLRELTLEEENIATSIYACLDTAVLLFLLKREGLYLETDSFFFNRNRKRIPDNLDYLTPWAAQAKEWNFPAMLLFSFLYWGEHRAGLNFDSYPVMKDFAQRFANAEGVEETCPQAQL